MTKLNFAEMTSKQLVEWYNLNVTEDKHIKKFSDRKVAERRCAELQDTIPVEAAPQPEPEVTDVQIETAAQRPIMSASLKLDRRIIRIDSEQVWKNAHTMWVENPDWMTSSQQDRLTAQLYKAAKRGEQIIVTVNDIRFQLLNV